MPRDDEHSNHRCSSLESERIWTKKPTKIIMSRQVSPHADGEMELHTIHQFVSAN